MEKDLVLPRTKQTTPAKVADSVKNFLENFYNVRDREAIACFLASHLDSDKQPGNTFYAYNRNLGEFLTLVGMKHDSERKFKLGQKGEFLALVGMKPLEEITRRDVTEYELKIGHYSPATQNQKKSVVRKFFSFCERNLEYLKADTASHLKNVKVTNQLQQRILSENEMASLINAGKNDLHQLILDLIYRSGVRVTELVSLQWGDLAPVPNSPDGILHIREGKGKKARSIRIDPYTYQDLTALRNGAVDNEPIFASKNGKPLHRTQINRIVEYARRDAGIDKKVSPHWLRHACASHGLDNGVSLATMRDQLGHENISTTSRYTHGKPEDSAALHLPHLRRKQSKGQRDIIAQ